MKRVGHEGQRVDGIAGYEFKEEEDRVDGEKDDDPSGLGPRHF